MGELCKATNKFGGKYSKPERPVKDKDGKTITEIKERRNRWVGCFGELLNRPAPFNPPYMKTSTSQEKHNIQWTRWIQFDYFNFTDDLVFLFYTEQTMQTKPNNVVDASSPVCLKIHKENRKIKKYYNLRSEYTEPDDKDLEHIEASKYTAVSQRNKNDQMQI
ncbi:unnamed protein product [Schistosoma mattheei]|uniref:Uncharacterized protein n=1 Tax=Schistosoma mattheei TaxID=31246 RepID=A0A183Q0Y7_9TREM|nr:unnamed protein product [Schistosoma mattheei]